MRMLFPLPDAQGKRTGKRKENKTMLRAMDSAVAGLRAHQNKLDVIGHNLANVNTFGYKAQTYSFKEAMYQTSTASTAGSADAGGANAAQYGYGTLMGTIGMDMTASTPSYVGGFNATINGEGFFITSAVRYNDGGDTEEVDADANLKTTGTWDYTRVGQFIVDSNGYMVDGGSNFVYGYRADAFTDGNLNKDAQLKPLRIPTAVSAAGVGSYNDGDPALKATNISINQLGKVTATITDADGNSHDGVEIGTVAIVTFQNPNGLTKSGGTYYKSIETDNSGRADAGVPGGDNATLMPGYIEASNVDMAKEFAEMITTHRGFQANTKMITVSDEVLSELVNMKR